jgi:hypothetical protein
VLQFSNIAETATARRGPTIPNFGCAYIKKKSVGAIINRPAVKCRNHRKPNAKTHPLNTFPGGKVAAKRTDEGTGSSCRGTDFPNFHIVPRAIDNRPYGMQNLESGYY